MPTGYRIHTQSHPPTVLGYATTRARAVQQAASCPEPWTITEESWDASLWHAVRANEIAQQRARLPWQSRPHRRCPPRPDPTTTRPPESLATLWWAVHADCHQWYRHASAVSDHPISNTHPRLRAYGRLLRTLSQGYAYEVAWCFGDYWTLSPRLLTTITTVIALTIALATSRWPMRVILRFVFPLSWHPFFPAYPAWVPIGAGMLGFIGIVDAIYHAMGGVFLRFAGWPWWPIARRLARLQRYLPQTDP